jgi:predicted nucleic acid-binding protein
VHFDTDVLIWALRGDARAATLIDAAQDPGISVMVYMELVQGAKDKRDLKLIRAFVTDLGFGILPLTDAIGHQASELIELHALKNALSPADAIIAATALQAKMPLCTGNTKHYRAIADLELRVFR